MSRLMVSVSGIRGVVGEGLTPEVVLRFAQAFGTYLDGGKVIVGRDSRVTGEMLKQAVLAGLTGVGCDVIDLGISTTPSTQMAVEHLEAEGSVMITASHNPIMWNGLKLIGGDGLFLDAKVGQRVVEISETQRFAFAPWDQVGVSLPYSKAAEEHLEAILKLPYLDTDAIRERRFKVALDCVCGAGAVIVPQLLEELGCTVIPLHCEPTGLFRRNPEPLPENLTELCDVVRDEGADVGFALDPDGDRLALVSEKGEPLGEEKTLALAVQLVLGKKAGPVVLNASTSRMSEDVARAAGVEVIRTRVGEIHVAKKMREVKAAVGGEGNGGVILPDLHLGRDAPVAVALTLQHMAEFAGPLSELAAALPQYVITKRKLELGAVQPQEALRKVEHAFSDATLDFTDGVKVVWPNAWVHVRPSNTEPIVRVIAEAPSAEASQGLCDQVLEIIRP